MEDFQAGTGFCLLACCYFAFCKRLPGFCVFENLVKTTETLPRKMLLRTGLGETHKWGMLFLGALVNCLTLSVALSSPDVSLPVYRRTDCSRENRARQSMARSSADRPRGSRDRPASLSPGTLSRILKVKWPRRGKALNKKSAFSDSTSVAGADRPSPSSSRCDPLPTWP